MNRRNFGFTLSAFFASIFGTKNAKAAEIVVPKRDKKECPTLTLRYEDTGKEIFKDLPIQSYDSYKSSDKRQIMNIHIDAEYTNEVLRVLNNENRTYSGNVVSITLKPTDHPYYATLNITSEPVYKSRICTIIKSYLPNDNINSFTIIFEQIV